MSSLKNSKEVGSSNGMIFKSLLHHYSYTWVQRWGITKVFAQSIAGWGPETLKI